MKLRRIVFSACLTALPACAVAQGLTPATLLKQPTDAWPTYNGDYSGRRFSPLTQINSSQRPHAVAGLGDALSRGGGGAEARGARRDRSDQVDAADGERHPVLHLAQPRVGRRRAHRPRTLALPIPAEHRQHDRQSRRRHVRQLAVLRIARQQPDQRSTRAPARSAGRCGSPIRSSTTPPPWRRSWSAITSSSASAATISTIPASWSRTIRRPARCNGSGGPRRARASPASRRGRMNTPRRTAPGMAWIPGTYDPELNLYIVGTGNPNPVMAEKSRKGDNLYTCSIVALNPGHRQAGLVFPALAARHARLGRGRDSGDLRRHDRRAAAQAGGAGQPQRLLLRARPRHRQAASSPRRSSIR